MKLMLSIIALIAIAGALVLVVQPNSPSTAAIPSVQTTPSAVPTASLTPSQQAVQTESDWSMLTEENVEKACLSVAKKQASDAGYSESLVFGCGCTANETPEVKSYSCTISALDGGHDASVTCTKSLKVCEISSEQGKVSYTFDELRALAGLN